jgi:hypothetical protein
LAEVGATFAPRPDVRIGDHHPGSLTIALLHHRLFGPARFRPACPSTPGPAHRPCSHLQLRPDVAPRPDGVAPQPLAHRLRCENQVLKAWTQEAWPYDTPMPAGLPRLEPGPDHRTETPPPPVTARPRPEAPVRPVGHVGHLIDVFA